MQGPRRLNGRASDARFLFQHGLSYIEVLIATIILAVSLVPAVEALRGGIFGADVHQAAASDHYHLAAKMESVLAEPYAALDAAAMAAGSETTPSSYSDAAGTPRRRLVYLSRYDGDTTSFTGTDTGLLWVRAVIEARAGELVSLTAR